MKKSKIAWSFSKTRENIKLSAHINLVRNMANINKRKVIGNLFCLTEDFYVFWHFIGVALSQKIADTAV